MKIYEYMLSRAKSENLPHELLKEHYEHLLNQGVRCFFGVLVDDSGKPLKDEQNPKHFKAWQALNGARRRGRSVSKRK